MKTKLIFVSFLLAASSAIAAFAETPDYLTPYAQARVYAGYVGESKEISASTTSAGKSDVQFTMKNVDARMGVKGKKGELEGLAELGFGKDAQNTSTDVKKSGSSVGSFNMSNTYVATRHIYGIWNFAEGMNVLFGQTEAPYAFYSTCASDNNANKGFGTTNQDRDVMLKLTVFGGYLSLMNPTVSPASGGALPGPSASPVSAASMTALFPKAAAGYEFKMKNDNFDIAVGPGLAGQAVKISKKTSTDPAAAEVILDGKTILSYLAYIHGKLAIGGFSVLGNFGYGQNTSNMGLRYDQGFTAAGSSLKTKLPGGSIAACAASDPSDPTKIKNATSMEGFVDAGYDFGMAELRGGFGAVSVTSYVSGSKKTRVQSQYFAQINVPLVAKKLWAKPEFAYRDYGKLGAVKQGKEWLAGIYLQANIE